MKRIAFGDWFFNIPLQLRQNYACEGARFAWQEIDSPMQSSTANGESSLKAG